MVTMIREYQALQALQYFPLRQTIVQPRPPALLRVSLNSDLFKCFQAEAEKPTGPKAFNYAQVDAMRVWNLSANPHNTGSNLTSLRLLLPILELR